MATPELLILDNLVVSAEELHFFLLIVELLAGDNLLATVLPDLVLVDKVVRTISSFDLLAGSEVDQEHTVLVQVGLPRAGWPELREVVHHWAAIVTLVYRCVDQHALV